MALPIFDEIIEIMLNSSPKKVAAFQLSEATMRRVEMPVAKEKEEGLSAEEKSELDKFVLLEHTLRLAKSRARETLRPSA